MLFSGFQLEIQYSVTDDFWWKRRGGGWGVHIFFLLPWQYCCAGQYFGHPRGSELHYFFWNKSHGPHFLPYSNLPSYWFHNFPVWTGWQHFKGRNSSPYTLSLYHCSIAKETVLQQFKPFFKDLSDIWTFISEHSQRSHSNPSCSRDYFQNGLYEIISQTLLRAVMYPTGYINSRVVMKMFLYL